MSLRTDVHRAFDEIAPSTFGVAERVIASALAGRSRRAPHAVFSPKLRGLASATAVVLLVLFAVTLLAGGRLYRDWNSLLNRPTTGLASLEGRPLQLPPRLQAGEQCPAGPRSTLLGMASDQTYGNGPVYAMPVMPATQNSWGSYGFQWLLIRRGQSGLVLGRGMDLVTGEPLIFVGTFATGAVMGTDTGSDGYPEKQYREVLLDADNPPQDTNPPEVNFAGSDNYLAWQVGEGLRAGSSGCLAFQFDGDGFTEVLVVPPAP